MCIQGGKNKCNGEILEHIPKIKNILNVSYKSKPPNLFFNSEIKYLMPERSLGLSLHVWYSKMLKQFLQLLAKTQETELEHSVSLGVQQMLDLQIFPAKILDIIKLLLHHRKGKMTQS